MSSLLNISNTLVFPLLIKCLDETLSYLVKGMQDVHVHYVSMYPTPFMLSTIPPMPPAVELVGSASSCLSARPYFQLYRLTGPE